MIRLLILCCFLFAALVAHATSAEPAPLDAKYLREHAQTRGFMLGRPVKARPTPDGKHVLFLRSEARKPKLALYEFDVATGKTRELLTPESLLKGADEKLSPEEKARRERQRIGIGGFTDYQLDQDGTQILLSLSGRLYVVERGERGASAPRAVRELKTTPGTIVDPKFSPDGKMVSYVKDNDVYVYGLADDKERAVTKGGSAAKTHGLAEFVAQEEMDRYSGYWWSPDSKFIVYEEADAGGVEVWYVADPAKPGDEPTPFFYPRPGKANVKVRVGIIGVPSPLAGEGKGEGVTTWIDWDTKKYEYLTQVRWEKYGPPTITVQNRLQNELALLKVDEKTGKTIVLHTVQDPAWVNVRQELPRWLEGGKGFLWAADSPEGTQLELYRPDGKLDHVVMPGKFPFRSLISLDPATGEILYVRAPVEFKNKEGVFRKSDNDPTRSDVWIMSKDANELLGEGDGVSLATAANGHKVFTVTTTSPGGLPRTRVYSHDRKLVGELPSVAESPGFTPKVEFTQVGEKPGFYCAIVRPHGFDPKKKYPVIVDVYGGPGHQVVVQAMRNWLLPQWLADQGFIVVAIDNRGTPNRGRDWERALYQKFGTVPLDDQVAGLQALGKKYPELDLDRVGIFGWSFGGYMAAQAVLKRPDVYKAAVAGAPVTDWLDYDTHYTERYLGLPEASPQAYKDASLLPLAANLKRPLLLIHGTADDNVYFRHSLKLADALFRAGKDFELLPLSGLTHMANDPVAMERLYGRIAGHFQKHLK